MFAKLINRGFDVRFVSHARAILAADFPDAVLELDGVLRSVGVPIGEIVGSGGGETKGTQRLRGALNDAGWRKRKFTIEKTINGVKRESTSHEVDHVRENPGQGFLALEIEWNNKDPFFDRDCENFKRLHAEGAISVGIIITRGASLQEEMTGLVNRFAKQKRFQKIIDLENYGMRLSPRQRANIEQRMTRGVDFSQAWSQAFVADKYGQATTHWRKLEARIQRGVGNPCPLLLIGLPSTIVTFD